MCILLDLVDVAVSHSGLNLTAAFAKILDDFGDTTAVPIWSEQPHYKHHSIRLKCEERVTCLLQ